MLAQRDLDLHARVVVRTEHLDHAPDRLRLAARLDDDLGGDHLARLGAGRRAGLDQQVVLDAPIGGGDERDAVLDVQPADDARASALHHFDDPRLPAPAPVVARRLREHLIAVHDLLHLARREIEIARAVVGRQEAVAVRVRLDAPAHDVDLLRDEDRALAVAQDLPVALHRGEPPRERLGLLPLHADELRERALVDRDRLRLERLQDELAARQRLGVAARFARVERVRGTAARPLAGTRRRRRLYASLSLMRDGD